ACMLDRGPDRVRQALDAHLHSDAIGEMTCVGHCYQGGGFHVDGATFGREDLERVESILAGDTADGHRTIPFHCAVPEPVLSGSVGEPEIFYRGLRREPTVILRELEHSGLRGRGGAGFPFATKLKSCAGASSEKKYIVCNGDEGDPGAFSDRWLLEERPHRVLGGMLAAGLAVGADSGWIYIRAEYPRANAGMAEAIRSYEATRMANETGFHFHIVSGAGSYVCGEETALLNSIEGLRPEVRVKPPYPTEAGLFGKPTLLSNVETFANLPWILEHGGESFARIGPRDSTGTKLVCLDQRFRRPGVYELSMGTRLEKVLYSLGGGFRKPVKAIQVGGPLGGVIPVAMCEQLTLDFASLEQAGFLLGHAGMVAIPEEYPLIDFLRHLFGYMADESCGKCVPCRLGTRKGYELLATASPEEPVDGRLFGDLLETLEQGSLCALGGGLPLPVRNLLEHFREELELFFTTEPQSTHDYMDAGGRAAQEVKAERIENGNK
ncbi:MAG: formate dehydrogenase, partial [Gammaproteobacteria bacterium]|nr:formate dehydrogenase [Gammaproteobacteria bacterium]